MIIITTDTIVKFVLTVLTERKKFLNQLVCLFSATGMQDDDATGKRLRKLSVGQYDNDVPREPSYNRCEWMKSPATHQAVIPGSPVAVGKTKEVNNQEFFTKY